jgi:hypothetical protein
MVTEIDCSVLQSDFGDLDRCGLAVGCSWGAVLSMVAFRCFPPALIDNNPRTLNVASG